MGNLYIDTGRTSIAKKYDDVTIERSFSQMYSGVFLVFMQINGTCAKNLLIWAVSRMDRWNHVILNKVSRNNFIDDAHKITNKKYADSTVKGAIKELIRVGIIISLNDGNKRESSYMLNPYFYWKTKSKSDRYEAIAAYINILKENEKNRI